MGEIQVTGYALTVGKAKAVGLTAVALSGLQRLLEDTALAIDLLICLTVLGFIHKPITFPTLLEWGPRAVPAGVLLPPTHWRQK